MATILEMKTKIEEAVASRELAELTGKEEVVKQKLHEEIDKIVIGTDEEKAKMYNQFHVIFNDFVGFLDNKYSSAVGRINGAIIRPFLKEVIKEKYNDLNLPKSEE